MYFLIWNFLDDFLYNYDLILKSIISFKSVVLFNVGKY